MMTSMISLIGLDLKRKYSRPRKEYITPIIWTKLLTIQQTGADGMEEHQVEHFESDDKAAPKDTHLSS